MAGTTTSTRAHAYDEAGNRLSTTVDGVLEHTWTYAEGNRLSTMDGVAAVYNDQGELTEDPRGYLIERVERGPDETRLDGEQIAEGAELTPLAWRLAREGAIPA